VEDGVCEVPSRLHEDHLAICEKVPWSCTHAAPTRGGNADGPRRRPGRP
jgi:hypothetical protein